MIFTDTKKTQWEDPRLLDPKVAGKVLSNDCFKILQIPTLKLTLIAL